MSLFSLANKTALVTGGCRGIGLDAAKGFVEAGAAKVYITARDQATLDSAVAEINAHAKSAGQTGQAYAIVADLSSSEGVKALVAAFSAKEKKLDVLFANAGLGSTISYKDSAFDKTFDDIFDVNVRSVQVLVLALQPLLAAAATDETTASVIITGSSVATTSRWAPEAMPYAASKAAVHHLSTMLAAHLVVQKIRVNAIACGLFPTRMSQPFRDANGDEEMQAGVPLSRFGRPSDIRGTTVYLASEASSYMTGGVLQLSGGSQL